MTKHGREKTRDMNHESRVRDFLSKLTEDRQ